MLTLRAARVWGLYLLVGLGIVLRVAYVDRPLDGRINNAWRQSDYFQLARNFHREGLNILYPRIDWRADTPGYAEMELPALPWVAGLLFGVTGEHAQVLRAVAAVLESVALVLFAWFAWRLIGGIGAWFAIAAFALNPILVTLGGAMQPEPLLHVCSLAAVVLLWRWQAAPARSTLLAAGAVAGLAVLAKMPALYLGMLFAYVVVRRLGRRAVFDLAVYGAALAAVLPALLWYTWAHHFWTRYGLSLGLTNESHFIGLDLLTPPAFVLGIAKAEVLLVWGPVGWLLGVAALRAPRSRWELPLVWYGATVAFYVVTARTSADWWASYYHLISVAPACLLMGIGLNALLGESAVTARAGAPGRPWVARLAIALAVVTIVAMVSVSASRIYLRDYRNELVPMYACLTGFVPLVPPDGHIVVRGGAKTDEHGHPVAHNESMAFAWMDRRGFNYADDDLSIETLDAIARRGGRYWIVNRHELHDARLAALVDGRYRRLATCAPDFALYDLRSE